MKENPDYTIAGATLEEWIALEMDDAPHINDYTENIAAGAWAGGPELQVAVHLKNVNISVFKQCRGPSVG